MIDPFQTTPIDIMRYIFSYIRTSYPMLRKVNRHWRNALAKEYVETARCMRAAIMTGYKVYLGKITHVNIEKYLLNKQHHELMLADYTWTYDHRAPDIGVLGRAYCSCMTNIYMHGEDHDNSHVLHKIAEEECIPFVGARTPLMCNFLNALFRRIISR